MQIYGLNKTTLLDYPEHVAATVFTGGCNFRCPFCHNAGLVVDVAVEHQIPEQEIMTFLKKRKGILDGICITGGEPTLQKDLHDFVTTVKEMGYLVKLDTNGYRPEVLKRLLADGLLDYVAMDLKADRDYYRVASGMDRADVTLIDESIELLMNGGIDYEFRTTVVRGIHTPGGIERAAKWIAGARAYYLQAFRDSENLICSYAGYTDFSKAEMEQMAEKARKYVDKVEIRGVE